MTVADVKNGVKPRRADVRRRPGKLAGAAAGGHADALNGRPPPQLGRPGDPNSLQDVFFRIGGATPGKADTGLVVNSDNVLLDNTWSWRADHGDGVGWTDNTADTGVIVNGDDVTAYGLFVEHYQKYNLIWNGENGRTIFFQNEMPYDPPNQAAWTHDGVNGYAAYKVADLRHKTHEAWGWAATASSTSARISTRAALSRSRSQPG